MVRNTAQRRVIRNIFVQTGQPLGPQDVLEEAKKRHQKIGIATVYRTIKKLVEEEWLVPVEIPGGAPRYEKSGKVHHHHFVCRVCNRVFDIEGCPGSMKTLAPAGFKVESHEVILYGLCPDCS
jgi:Fur family ferric uptake transcriptional regulator